MHVYRICELEAGDVVAWWGVIWPFMWPGLGYLICCVILVHVEVAMGGSGAAMFCCCPYANKIRIWLCASWDRDIQAHLETWSILLFVCWELDLCLRGYARVVYIGFALSSRNHISCPKSGIPAFRAWFLFAYIDSRVSWDAVFSWDLGLYESRSGSSQACASLGSRTRNLEGWISYASTTLLAYAPQILYSADTIMFNSFCPSQDLWAFESLLGIKH